ncbi:FMR1 neighbor protein [Lonchura striata]
MLNLTGHNCIRTFILVHFCSDYSRRATVYVQNCTNLTLPLYFGQSVVAAPWGSAHTLLKQGWRKQQKMMLPFGTHRAWVFMVLLLLGSVHSLLAAPIEPGSEQSAEAASKPNMTMEGVFVSFLSFFRPMTCRLSNQQLFTPCPVEGLNMSECSKMHCCPFRIGQEEQCYMPVRDDVQLAIRVVLLTGGGFLILGFLPICCCALLQRR